MPATAASGDISKVAKSMIQCPDHMLEFASGAMQRKRHKVFPLDSPSSGYLFGKIDTTLNKTMHGNV